MYDEITGPYRDERAYQPKGIPAHAEHKGPVAATLDLLSVCLEVYLAEIDGPTHPPEFVRASLDVLDHCIGEFTPTDAATVGRLTTTLLDAGDAHERASRCILQWCDEACAFLQGFLDLRGSDKPRDGQVLVSAILTEGRTILMDAVGSLADTISLLEAAQQELDWLLSRPEASLGVLRVACAQPNDAEDFEVVDVENGDLNETSSGY
ncbi:hypothetical protein SPRG_05520 [Saprolegnia parasitica CBS 223.65]|uniref:Uncharacterized protein n=1 Tax=Saprolegnia parasitica (strain CBS 223.65) TaxID=695850 RepID=A0A067CFN6_SAPPC|nr:hypothetical protein SPRG_05520 [Saprolegnia parasitica CBS 223.65]KDO29564.1 hypothetical protein SPRG_05520 [Saprolegnia parasitica CBS 223.65]|eukprot:XP_012199629.1 hypothetical protein SPRG_05520 [Saprolegnia parasitica CBS 223.65]